MISRKKYAFLLIVCALSSTLANSGEDGSNEAANANVADDPSADFHSAAGHAPGEALEDDEASDIESYLLLNVNSQDLSSEIREIVLKAHEDAREMRKHAREDADNLVRAARLAADRIRETASEEARRVVDMIITEGRRYEAEERLLMEGEREFHQKQIAELKVEQALTEASLLEVRNSLTSRHLFIRFLQVYGVATTLMLLYVLYLARRQAVDIWGHFEKSISNLKAVGNSLKAKALVRRSLSVPTPAASQSVDNAPAVQPHAPKVEMPHQSGLCETKRESLTRSWNEILTSSKLANSGGLKLSKSASSNMDSMFDLGISPIEVSKKL